MTKAEQLKASNQSGKYWLLEDPEEIYLEKNVIRYYPNAKRLVVHLGDYYNLTDKEVRPGKGTGLKLDDLAADQDALKRVIEIFSSYLDEEE